MQLESTQQDNNASKAHSSRRGFLKAGLGLSAGLVVPNAFANIIAEPERKLSFLNLHTGESINATYWAEGQYQVSELDAINRVLRDHRTGDIHNMDHKLLELLNILHQRIDSKQAFHVISAYRSEKSNAYLRQNSSGVAKKSFHMKGMAMDIRLPKCQLSSLRTEALKLKAGGVGYYPKSDFIHVDTGHVRHWG